jgi:hypothetical protein
MRTFTYSIFLNSDEDKKPAALPSVPKEIQIAMRKRLSDYDQATASTAAASVAVAAAAIPKKKRGIDAVWKRAEARNERDKLMDIDKDDLTEGQMKQRKAAKRTSKSMLKNEGNKK